MNNFHSQFNQETKKEEAAHKATSSWMNNPKLTGIDMSKLAMLNALAEQGSAKKTPTRTASLSHVCRFCQYIQRSTFLPTGNRGNYSSTKNRKITGRSRPYGQNPTNVQNALINNHKADR